MKCAVSVDRAIRQKAEFSSGHYVVLRRQTKNILNLTEVRHAILL